MVLVNIYSIRNLDHKDSALCQDAILCLIWLTGECCATLLNVVNTLMVHPIVSPGSQHPSLALRDAIC